MKQYTRFEVIGPSGRMIVHYGKAEASEQDEGRTLKVFINKEYGGPLLYAKHVELIQRLVDALQYLGDIGVWYPEQAEALNAAEEAGFKPSDQ